MAPPADDCPLSRAQQTRNLLLFGSCVGAIYLTAPIGYVGVTQAPLCRRLGASDAVANLPQSLYMVMTAVPVVIAWALPYVSWLKINLAACFGLTAAAVAGVALALVAPVANEAKIAAVIVHAAVHGALTPTAIALLWEAIGRGLSEKRRGVALGLGYGAGPVLAFAASLGSQLVLNGQLGPLRLWVPGFPANFALLYASAVPVLVVAAVLAGRLIIPLPAMEAQREAFVDGVLGGVWNVLRDRVLLTATVVTLLLYTGNAITSNMALYAPELLGGNADDYSGDENAFRFGAKAVAGVVLGWLLTRTSPRAGIVTTALLVVAALAWALFAPARLYLWAFGIYGAGELVGVYCPNYVLSASRPQQVRTNMAFVTLLMVPAAPIGLLFGAISDHYRALGRPMDGYRWSFALCAAVVIAGILLALLRLPARPSKRQDLADRESP